MTDIQKDTGQNDSKPFVEDAVPRNYFPGGGRGEVLSQMVDGVEKGVALLILTGDEGSGKTTLCQMFEKELYADSVTVYFPRTVDSFDDVVKIIARRLEVRSTDEATGRNRDGTLQEIADCLQKQSKKLLVIFDEAENIYLATLERIRKMLDRVWALGGRMHILFSGRTTFNENYDQLSICDFARSDELYFSLRPLTAAETVDYLRLYTAQCFEDSEHISDELAVEISQLADGNFRRIKELARQSMSNQGGDDSFMVLLESVEEETETEGDSAGKQDAREKLERAREVGREILSRGKARLIRMGGDSAAVSRTLLARGRKAVPELAKSNERLIELFGKYRASLPYIGAGACALLLLVIFFNLGEGGKRVEQRIHEDNVVDVPVVAAENDPEQVEPAEVAIPVETSVAEEMQPEPADETDKQQEDASLAEVVESGGSVAEEAAEAQGEKPEPDAGPADKLEIQPVVIVEEEKLRPQLEKKVVELKPSPGLKNKPPSVESSGKGNHTITLQPRQEVQKKSQAGSRYAARQLLAERMQAGMVWQRGEKGDHYTVQLMVLGSQSAEDNLVQMLSEDRYRQEAGNFYILKKRTAPANLFVFYGEYPSIATARLAQNSLPQFLRSHKPYAISIKGAIAKVQ